MVYDPLLFPREPIDLVVVREDECCPFCGENRVTDCLYGFVTFLCGFSAINRITSGGGEIEHTKCQGDRFESFIEK